MVWSLFSRELRTVVLWKLCPFKFILGLQYRIVPSTKPNRCSNYLVHWLIGERESLIYYSLHYWSVIFYLNETTFVASRNSPLSMTKTLMQRTNWFRERTVFPQCSDNHIEARPLLVPFCVSFSIFLMTKCSYLMRKVCVM